MPPGIAWKRRLEPMGGYCATLLLPRTTYIYDNDAALGQYCDTCGFLYIRAAHPTFARYRSDAGALWPCGSMWCMTRMPATPIVLARAAAVGSGKHSTIVAIVKSHVIDIVTARNRNRGTPGVA